MQLPNIFQRLSDEIMRELGHQFKSRTFYDQLRQPRVKKGSLRNRHEEKTKARATMIANAQKRIGTVDPRHVHPRHLRAA